MAKLVGFNKNIIAAGPSLLTIVMIIIIANSLYRGKSCHNHFRLRERI